jgi:hypothetical protein
LVTVNDPVLTVWRSAALSNTCNVVGLTKLVVRGAPFHSTIEFVSKPPPVNVIVAA